MSSYLPRRPRQLIPIALVALALLFLSLPSHTTPPPARAIVTLASTSARLSHELPPTLWSLLRQSSPPLQIRLHLPKEEEEGITERMKKGELSEVFGHERVLLVWSEDEGPATKFLGTVRDLLERAAAEEELLDQPVVVVDDDHVYSPELVRTLLEAHDRMPGAAVGMRGWRVREDLRWGVEWGMYWRHVLQGWQLKDDYRVGVLTANEVCFFVPFRARDELIGFAGVPGRTTVLCPARAASSSDSPPWVLLRLLLPSLRLHLGPLLRPPGRRHLVRPSFGDPLLPLANDPNSQDLRPTRSSPNPPLRRPPPRPSPSLNRHHPPPLAHSRRAHVYALHLSRSSERRDDHVLPRSVGEGPLVRDGRPDR